MRTNRLAIFCIVIFPVAGFWHPRGAGQEYDVSQSNISGSGSPAELGNPFGQTFRPTRSEALTGVTLGLVSVNSPSDLTVRLYLSDGNGSLIGSPLATGFLTASQVGAFGSQIPATPAFVSVLFDSPYAQSPGESLAFAIDPNPMSFYFGPGNSYSGGQMLGDPGKDLVFSTMVIPEPATSTLLVLSLLAFAFGTRRVSSDSNRRV